jgi:putative SOS response-associated peptidase YedK
MLGFLTLGNVGFLMCGRYVIKTTPDLMRTAFGYAEQPNFPPRYNVAPTQPIPVVRIDNGRRSFALLRWGLIPSWVKDPRGFSLLINARAESVLDKPAFRNAMRRRRCLIPADGFYEWKQDGARRQPFFAAAKGPVAFAGLWEPWMGPNGEEMETACIVTTTANRTLRPLHDRMPAVVPPQAFDLWLDCAHVDAETAAALLVPAPEDTFTAHAVSPAVNRTANDSPDLIAPLAPGAAAAAEPVARARPKAKKDDGQASLF